MKKNIDLEDLSELVKKLKNQGNRIVLCHGVFDLMHLGHIKYFKEARSYGEILIVTITPDEFVRRGPGRPIFNSEQRAEAIASLEIVDFVSINKWDTAVNTINLIKPDFYVKGPDYKNHLNDVTGKIILEQKAIEEHNGEIKFTSSETFSSTKLIKNNFSLFTKKQKHFLDNIKNKYSFKEIKSFMDMLMPKKVLIVGEAIIDEYIPCNTLGKAGKDPIMTLKKLTGEKYAGGSLAIANHISDFVEEVNVISYIGQKDTFKDFMFKNVKKNVNLHFFNKSNSPTIHKLRYLDRNAKSKIIGIYDINDDIIQPNEEKIFENILKEQNSINDSVIVADYGHGLLSEKIINYIIENAKHLSVNTQLNSANYGFHTISKYKRIQYACMHEGELRHDFRSRSRKIEDLAIDLYKRVNAETVTVTRGDRGALCYDSINGFENCPAFANKIIDKVGAGDTLFSFTALSNSVEMPNDISLLLGSLAASETVASLGNSRSISKVSLIKTLETIFK